jgi:hypothetical protein
MTRVDDQGGGLDGGLMTWTFVIDSANCSGPLVAYVPEHWSLRIDRWNAMEILNDVYPEDLSDPIAMAFIAYVNGEVSTEDLQRQLPMKTGTEVQPATESLDLRIGCDLRTLSATPRHANTSRLVSSIASFTVEGSDVRTFLKVFPPQIPSAADRKPFVRKVQSFDVDLCNNFVDTFQMAENLSASVADFEGLGNPLQVERWGEGPWAGIEVIDLESFDSPDEVNLMLRVPLTPCNERGETNIDLNWGRAQPDERGWSTYYEMIEGVPRPVSSTEVPAELIRLEYGTRPNTTSIMRNKDPKTVEDSSCYTCDDPTGCDDTEYETVTDDGSRITYRWNRFADQPVFDHLRSDYSDVSSDPALEDLGTIIEAMHSEWGSRHQLLERPTGTDALHLAEIDHGLLVEPPPAKENGWVPIVLEVELPDGIWETHSE